MQDMASRKRETHHGCVLGGLWVRSYFQVREACDTQASGGSWKKKGLYVRVANIIQYSATDVETDQGSCQGKAGCLYTGVWMSQRRYRWLCGVRSLASAQWRTSWTSDHQCELTWISSMAPFMRCRAPGCYYTCTASWPFGEGELFSFS